MVPTVDVLESLGRARNPRQVLLGFALESQDGLTSAESKRIRKGADAIVLNYATPETGMNSDQNQLTMVSEAEVVEGPLETKEFAAKRILDWVEAFVLKA